jgi:hypothetical protein
MRYGNHSADLYTGRVPVSIPIYTYQDYDFTLPISVDYVSDGYKPNIQTGILGLGWTLNAGGCITREMRGIPDEAQNMAVYVPSSNGNTTYIYHHYGYYSYHQTSDMMPLNSAIYENLTTGGAVPIICNNIESEPDIFHFNFPGHSGSFMLGPHPDTIYVFNTGSPQGEYKVKLDEFHSGIIKIQTGDGYTYTFGSTTQNKIDTYTKFEELKMVSQSSLTKNRLDDYSFNYRMTWMLTKIEAPNARAIQFLYSAATLGSSKQYDTYRAYANNIVSEHTYTFNDYMIRYDTVIGYTRQRGVSLEEIVIDNSLHIYFTYIDKRQEKGWGLHPTLTTPQTHYPKFNLINELGSVDSIIVKETPTSIPLKTYKFAYYIAPDTTQGNIITFLDTIYMPEGGFYLFDYYDKTKAFPYHGTGAIDHWGYYNQANNNTSRIGPGHLTPRTNTAASLDNYIYFDASYTEHITSLFPNREPNLTAARMGMLKSITYPTGGYTRFDYEQHSYSQKVHRYQQSDFYPTCVNANVGGYTHPNASNYPAGGVRIKRIVDFSSSSDSTYREFVYRLASNASSGILLHYPRYRGGITFTLWSSDNAESYVSKHRISGSATQIYPKDRSHISYPLVKEIFSDGSMIEHRYKNYTDTPDQISTFVPIPRDAAIYDLETKELNLYPYLITYPTHPSKLYRHTISLHNLRGKLSGRKYYDKNAMLLSETTYSYGGSNSYIGHLAVIRSNLFYYKAFDEQQTNVSNYNLTSEQTTEYRGSSTITFEKGYKYNSVGRLSEVSTTDSNGDARKTTYTYVADNKYPDQLYQDHKLSLPVEQNDYIKSNGSNTWQHIQSFQNTYTFPDNTQTSRTTQAKRLNPSTGSLSGYVTEYTYVYDEADRVISVTDKAGMKTAYLWGYNGLYPIAEIKNIGTATPAQSYLDESDFQNIQNLHATLRTAYPQAQVTVYTYKPSVGKTSEKAPDGTMIYYEYDATGRLKWTYTIVNGEVQFLEGNKYQYTISNP